MQINIDWNTHLRLLVDDGGVERGASVAVAS